MTPWIACIGRDPVFFNFRVIDLRALEFLGVEAVKVGMPAGTFAADSADLGLIVVQGSQTGCKVREVCCRGDFPVAPVAVDHGQVFHCCEGMIGS